MFGHFFVWLLYPKQQGGKCCVWALLAWLLFTKQQEGNAMVGALLVGCFFLSNREGSAQIGSTFLSLAALLLLCFWKCASGINDKDTVDVTDGKLGKELPGRTLEVD